MKKLARVGKTAEPYPVGEFILDQCKSEIAQPLVVSERRWNMLQIAEATLE